MTVFLDIDRSQCPRKLNQNFFFFGVKTGNLGTRGFAGNETRIRVAQRVPETITTIALVYYSCICCYICNNNLLQWYIITFCCYYIFAVVILLHFAVCVYI